MANQFNAVLVNFSRIHNVLALHDEANFVYNVSDWISVQPILFHGHFPYIEFAKFGSNTRPLWINVIRDPLERQVSYYYFIRYGDNLRPHVTRSRQGDSTTFDECVAKELSRDCSNETLWMQIPYFCGNAQHCTIPGSLWAFEEAKRNVIEKYLLVGTVDDLQDFANVLEHLVPYYFTGLSKLYQKGDNHIRQTRFKQALKEETISKIKQTDTYRLELLFYRFVKANFEQVKARVLFQHKRSQYEYPFIYQKARGPTLRFDT